MCKARTISLLFGQHHDPPVCTVNESKKNVEAESLSLSPTSVWMWTILWKIALCCPRSCESINQKAGHRFDEDGETLIQVEMTLLVFYL